VGGLPCAPPSPGAAVGSAGCHRHSSIDRWLKAIRRSRTTLVAPRRSVVEPALIAASLTQINQSLHRIGQGKGLNNVW
jgi:hypothetical protein